MTEITPQEVRQRLARLEGIIPSEALDRIAADIEQTDMAVLDGIVSLIVSAHGTVILWQERQMTQRLQQLATDMRKGMAYLLALAALWLDPQIVRMVVDSEE